MKDRNKILLTVGQMCKRLRENQGVKQSQVARETGYSEQNISSFETGRTNNMIILLWYVDRGLFDMGNRLIVRNMLRGKMQ